MVDEQPLRGEVMDRHGVSISEADVGSRAFPLPILHGEREMDAPALVP
jgi:hypothetical protein